MKKLAVFLLLAIIINCSKKQEEEIIPEVVVETFELTSEQTTIKPLQFVLITSSEINFSEESYKATIDDIEIDLFKTENNSLIFSVPDLNTGSKKLKITIHNKVGELSFSVEENVVQNIEKVVKEELVDPLNEFGNEISNLLLDDTYPLEIKDQLSSSKKMLDDFLIKYNASSDEEKMNIAKFFNSNPILTSDYLNLSSKSNLKMNPRYSGIINIIESIAEATVIVILSVEVLAPVLTSAFTASAAFLVSAGAIVATLTSAVLVGAIIGAAIYKINNDYLTPVNNQLADLNGEFLDKSSNKSDDLNKKTKTPYQVKNKKENIFKIISYDRLLNASDINNSNSDIVSLVQNLNKLNGIWDTFKNTVNTIISSSTNFFSSWMGSSSTTYKPISFVFETLPSSTPIVQSDGNSEFISIEGFPNDVEVEYSVVNNTSIKLKFKADETTLPRTINGNIKYNDGNFTNSKSFSVRIAPTELVLEKVSGDNQTGEKNKQLENPIVVKVTDEDSNVVSNIDVVFNITSGGGILSNTIVKTNNNGLAEVNWNLGDVFGNQSMEVIVKNSIGENIVNSPINFYAFSQINLIGNWNVENIVSNLEVTANAENCNGQWNEFSKIINVNMVFFSRTGKTTETILIESYPEAKCEDIGWDLGKKVESTETYTQNYSWSLNQNILIFNNNPFGQITVINNNNIQLFSASQQKTFILKRL